MKRILTALVLIPLVLLAVFKAPSWLFTLLVGAVALLALKEYLDLVEAYGVKPIRWLSYAYLGFTFTAFAYAFWSSYISPFAVLFLFEAFFVLWPFIFLTVAMRSSELSRALPTAAYSGFGLVYVGLAMLTVGFLQGVGWYPLVFTFSAVWAGDITAMYTGKAIGKHRMAPQISPNKTWEGTAGSIIGSVLACGLLAHFAPSIHQATHPGLMNTFQRDHASSLSPAFALIAAILLNIAAQLGDLVESLIKRGANVKDSGTMLPGHGGILDRIDALLFAAPVALILFEFIR
jgi:phosphatidate cytidylyltransferase